MKPTIKEVRADGFVVKTLQRAALMEVQTPQVSCHQPSPPSEATTQEVEASPAAETYLICPCANHGACITPRYMVPVPLPDSMPTQVHAC